MYNTLKGVSSRKIKAGIIITSLIMLMTVICGCSLNSVRVNIIKDEREGDNEIINVEIPQISGMSEEFCDNLNNELKNYANDKIEAFIDEAQKTHQERDGKAKLDTEQKVKFNKKNFLSVIGDSFEYTSGMTGAASRVALNIDTESEKRLYLCDLFNDEEYVGMLNARLDEISIGEEYADIWERPVIGEEQNECFYLSDNGLVIYYPPYELSYYARGFVEFTIPYSELYGYLKPEYAILYNT